MNVVEVIPYKNYKEKFQDSVSRINEKQICRSMGQVYIFS